MYYTKCIIIAKGNYEGAMCPGFPCPVQSVECSAVLRPRKSTAYEKRVRGLPARDVNAHISQPDI